MKKPRLAAIEYIRGISMLGVIGIHVGSQYLANPMANTGLVALFEVATRFSVPIFFFVSAFGLFYNLDPERPFSYREFLKRRINAVLIPYIVWSVFYLLHYVCLWGDTSVLSPFYMGFSLVFGTANYHLYFMVLLLWFYLLMPLWRKVALSITRKGLVLLLVAQVAFDYCSSFMLSTYNMEPSFLKLLLEYRLNYWVLHYVFIFLLGAYAAIHIDSFLRLLKKNYRYLAVGFSLSLGILVGYYYWLMASKGYTPLEAINTAHQLCPAGILYTIMASLFLFALFTYGGLPDFLQSTLSFLGKHSYFVYLVHPLVITYLSLALRAQGMVMGGGIALGFYVAVAGISLCLGAMCRSMGEKYPIINKLTIGITKK